MNFFKQEMINLRRILYFLNKNRKNIERLLINDHNQMIY